MDEIEKKYLVKPTILNFITQFDLSAHEIAQFYTFISKNKSIRYRKMNDNYYKTIKKGTGAVREEKEKEITKKAYDKKYKKHIGKVIVKSRYILTLNSFHYDIDVYHGELSGLYTLEVEFPNINDYNTYQVPNILTTHLCKDVTLNEQFKNKNLSLYGIPSEPFNGALFGMLDEIYSKELESFHIGNIKSHRALCLILYKFSLLILYYKDRILHRTDPEDLHQFRVNLRRSRAFLKTFKSYFPSNFYKDTYKILSFYASNTNHARDLDVLREQFINTDKQNKHTLKRIDKKRHHELKKIQNMLSESHFMDFFAHYRSILQTLDFEKCTECHLPMKTLASKVLTRLHQNIICQINEEEKYFDPKRIHKIRISFKKLRYLLEEFEEIFDKDRIQTYINTGKKLQTVLGKYNDAVNQTLLLKQYQADYQESQKKVTDTLIKERKKEANRLLKKVQKRLYKFKKEDFIL